MLVLSRRQDQQIMIGDDVVVTVIEIRGDKVRLGISAPTHISVHRQEIFQAIQNQREAEIASRDAASQSASEDR